jgi:hypothetical protein
MVYRVVGLEQEEDSSRQAPQFSMSEIEEFKKFARKPNAQQRIFDMIAPQIFGSESIKKAVACLLFGGSRKVCFVTWCIQCRVRGACIVAICDHLSLPNHAEYLRLCMLCSCLVCYGPGTCGTFTAC